MGLVSLNNSDYTKSLEYYDQALEIQKIISGKYTNEIIETLDLMGLVSYNKKDYAQSLSYYQKALKVRIKIQG